MNLHIFGICMKFMNWPTQMSRFDFLLDFAVVKLNLNVGNRQLAQLSCFRIIHRVKRGLFGSSVNLNCVDPLGRGALLMAIDNENLQVIKLFYETT